MNTKEIADTRFYTDNIRTFVVVARLGGVGRAARSMGLSQPSVSQQILRLEALVGRSLFKREKVGVVLTPDGETLLHHAESMIEISEAIGRSFGIDGRSVHINVGITEMFNQTSLHRVLWLVARQIPDLSLRIVSDRTEVLKAGFDRGEFDVVVAGPFTTPPLGQFVRREQMVWIGRPDHPRPIPDPIHLILPINPSRVRTVMLDALEGAGRSWTANFEACNYSSAEAAIDAGFGYCAAPWSMPLRQTIHLDAESGLPPLPSIEYYVQTKEGRGNDVVLAFCNLVFRALDDNAIRGEDRGTRAQ